MFDVSLHRRSGVAYIMALLLILLLGTIALAFVFRVQSVRNVAASRGDAMQAQYLAESAANHAMWRLLNDPGFLSSVNFGKYYMHSFAGGRYGYKVRKHTATTFATVATIGVFGEQVARQSYVLYVKQSADSMAVWYSASGTATKYNIWLSSAFAGALNTPSLGAIAQGLQGASCPTRYEKIVIGIDTSGNLRGEVWDGKTWTTIPSGSLGAPGFSHPWAYDVAYEQKTGNALIVFADGSNLLYAEWDGKSWSGVQKLGNYATLTGNTPKRVALAAKPGDVEIALVVTENLGKTFGLIWNGSNWGNGTVLQSGTGVPNTSSAVTYEQKSGIAVATYGKGFADSKVYYRIWDGASWSTEASTTAPGGYGSGDNPSFTMLASDPNSDRIVLGVTTANSTAPKTWMNIWDGATWGTAVVGTTTAVSYQYPAVAVVFEGKSGDALAAFGNAGLNYVYYKTWTSADGWLSVQGLGPGVSAVPNTMILESDPCSDQIFVAAQNSSGALYYSRWGGSPPFEAPIQLDANTGGAPNYRPFLFLWGGAGSGSGPTTLILSPSADAFVKFDKPAENTGSMTEIKVRGTSKPWQSLIVFNVSPIDPGTILMKAVLRLYVTTDGNGAGTSITAFRATENWTEMEATWNDRLNGVAWATAGGTYAASGSATASATGNTGYWMELDITPIAQGWVAGTLPNYGVLLQSDGTKEIRFASKENGTAANIPQLVITY